MVSIASGRRKPLHCFKMRFLLVSTIFISVFFVPQVASADSLTLTVNPSSLTASPGGTVIFTGTVTNNTGVDLNATDLFANFSSFDSVVVTVTQLLGNPDFLLPDGATSIVVDLFSVTLDPSAVLGNIYSVDVFLQDINDNMSNSMTFDVTASPSAVPEPPTLLLLETGVIGTVAVLRRRRK